MATEDPVVKPEEVDASTLKSQIENIKASSSLNEAVEATDFTDVKESNDAEKRKIEGNEESIPVAKISKLDDGATKPDSLREVETTVAEDETLCGVNDAEKEMLELAGVAAVSTPVIIEQSRNSTEMVETEVVEDTATTILNNFEGVESGSNTAPVEIVVEQDAPVKPEQDFYSVSATPTPVIEPVAETPQTNTATVAAPQGVNPAMMSNLLHTAAAVAAAQNVAAATVQVIPGQAAGTIQLVPATEVQKTQELMAAGLPPQNMNQSPEEMAKNAQPVFSYLVTSQGTLIAAHASDGSELISGSNSSAKTVKRMSAGRGRKPGKPKAIVKKVEPGVGDPNDRKFMLQQDIVHFRMLRSIIIIVFSHLNQMAYLCVL